MRIDPNANLLGASGAARPNKSSSRPGATNLNREPSAGDVAELSPGQARVRSLETRVAAMPEIRQQKVEALRHAIGSGSYEVSNGKTAEAILSALTASLVLR